MLRIVIAILTARSVAAPPPLHAFEVSTDRGPYLVVRGDGAWQVTAEPPVPEVYVNRSIVRLIDAGGVAGGPWVAAVVRQYDGGSERGEEETWLVMLDGSRPDLPERARVQIGAFVWQLAAEERWKISDPSDLNQRPHLEVALTPSFGADGVLTLRPKTRPLSARKRARWEASPCDEELDDCRFSRLLALQRTAGRWVFDGHTFMRAPR